MIELNLETNTDEERRIKQYLEENVSESIADKINNGVHITKDNTELISKKDLPGFMKYALGEAKKLASKNAIGACVLDTTVYGWAIHYFEEDSIEGNLFNLDGSEYKVKEVEKQEEPKQEKPAEKPNPQQNMFDLMFDTEEIKVEEKQPLQINKNLIVDQNTGIIETSKALTESFDEQSTILLCSILGDIVEII